MKKFVFFVSFFIWINGFAQTEILKLNRKEAIKHDSIGETFFKNEKYQEAIIYFEKVLEKDSTYGEAIFHRVMAINNSGIKGGKSINICDVFQKAYNYGAKISDDILFFYSCKLKKRN